MTKIKKTIDFQVYFNATIFSTILRKRRFSAEKKGDFIMSVDVTKMPKLGFGMMRLPEKDGELDLEQICKMVDAYLASGMNYFDTAYMYCGGKSAGRASSERKFYFDDKTPAVDDGRGHRRP